MKSLVIFDSTFGNTKIIAEVIAKELGDECSAVSVVEFNTDILNEVELLVVGSPIIGWKPSEKMNAFLSGLKKDQLLDIKAAAFDTRIKLFIHGDAAIKISEILKNAGANIISDPKPFYVRGTEGPLLEGEVSNAINWASYLRSK